MVPGHDGVLAVAAGELGDAVFSSSVLEVRVADDLVDLGPAALGLGCLELHREIVHGWQEPGAAERHVKVLRAACGRDLQGAGNASRWKSVLSRHRKTIKSTSS